MATRNIAASRIQTLNARPVRDGVYVLYWMQQSQRAEGNHALEYAVQRANALGLPPVVAFGITDAYPEANARHYRFMLQGLAEVREDLLRRGIGFVARRGDPPAVARELAGEAALTVCDRGYLRHQRRWRERVAGEAPCPVVQVEADAVVPVEAVSGKAEYAARTIRPKLAALREEYLVALAPTPARRRADAGLLPGMDVSDPAAVLRSLRVDETVGPVDHLCAGGPRAARRTLDAFVENMLPGYRAARNQPQSGRVSHLGMYLHFGQISPVEVALRVRDADAPAEDRETFLEELLVRRELSLNFVQFTPRYDAFEGLPGWARRTLEAHAGDPRNPRYDADRLEAADTHDPYWNAAMREMRHTGYMHNYMRMYWGKKILEWLGEPREAYAVALALNNKYFLDGRDPNSYAGVGWVFGLHDRPWKERPIFGTVRFMSAAGLERKCDIAAYVARVNRMVRDMREEA